MIKDIVRLNSLYDYYGKLLTDNQRQSFYYYYFLDFSLSEISEEIGISKQGVSENLKRATKELEKYEEVLKLHDKNKNTKLLLNQLESFLKNDNFNSEECRAIIKKIVEELRD